MSEAQSPAAPVESSAESSSQEESTLEASEGQEESSGSTEANIDADPTLTKAEKVEAKKMLKSLKIKFNGREIEEALPFEIPDDPASIDYMKKQLQMSKLGQSKSQELAELQKQAMEFISELKKNPRKILSDPNIGVDLKKIATEILEEEIENSKKSPEQVEKEKLQARLKELEDERKKEKDDFQRKEIERIKEQAYERYETSIMQTLEKSDLPKTPYTVKKMAEYMLLGLNNKIDVAPEDVLELVRDEMHNDLNEMFAVMPEEVIEKVIGKETINRLRKKNLQKAKQAIAKPQIADTGVKSTEAKGSTEKKVDMKTFFGF